jgi:hypothetical protein
MTLMESAPLAVLAPGAGTCDHPGCREPVWRGRDSLCGSSAPTPRTHRDTPHPPPVPVLDPSQPGCGGFFCGHHGQPADHGCPRPACGRYSADGTTCCDSLVEHDGQHHESWTGRTFADTEPAPHPIEGR